MSDPRLSRVGGFAEQLRELLGIAPSFRTRKWDSKPRGVHPPRGFGSLLRHQTSLNLGEHFPRLSFGWAIATVRRHARISNAREERLVRIAPSFAQAIGRSALIALAVEIVVAGGFAILGRPTLARLHGQYEIARFAPSEGHESGQFRPCASSGSPDLKEIRSTA